MLIVPVTMLLAAVTAGEHPGNVFVEGQAVQVRTPRDLSPASVRWRLLDDAGIVLEEEPLKPGSEALEAGALGIGWYRVEFLDSAGALTAWTTCAVLARRAAPVPPDSPVCVDVAASWFAHGNQADQERFARLAALAGVSWVRDRLKWREIEPERGRFAADTTTYDTSARAQNSHGLKVLQVFHDTPAWAVESGGSRGRLVRDLRHIYRFCRAMGTRFKGYVQAWEPWNEGNCTTFGGHTVDELCSYQKAAYLGFKAADPTVTVGWNAYTGVPTFLHTRGVLLNETWPYFDTYNIHTYDRPDSYEKLWAPVREAACGRPLWVTESDRGMKYATPAPWHDLSQQGELLKAHFMAQSYASSISAGAHRHFHFILGHYTEDRNGVQFGLLRLDKTPRPSYVALAAVGRFLAGAHSLGQWSIAHEPNAHVHAFRSFPDGIERDVLVAWAERAVEWPERGKTSAPWKLPPDMTVRGVFDYLGRSRGTTVPDRLRSAPIFVVLETGHARKLELRRTEPARIRYPEGAPTPVVLQLQMPRSATRKCTITPWAQEYEYVIEPESEIALPLFIYNLGDRPARGTVTVEHLPAGWHITPRTWEVTLAPMGRIRITGRVTRPRGTEGDRSADTWIRLRGTFGDGGPPVLAFRLVTVPGEGYERR